MEAKFPWVVYYGSSLPAESFEHYNPIVLDPQFKPSIELLVRKNKEVLGYISLAEIENGNEGFSLLKEKELLIQENANWKGSWAIDVRSPFWQELLLEKIIPTVLSKGFTGLLIDQIDVAIEIEQKDPKKYKGMKEAVIHLVKEIHQRFPEKRLMINRAYKILPAIAKDITYVLAETLYTSYDFQAKKYILRSSKEYEWQLSQMNTLRLKFPHLVMFSLDYWSPEDTKMYTKIYQVEREACLRPYVSSIQLNQLIPEP